MKHKYSFLFLFATLLLLSCSTVSYLQRGEVVWEDGGDFSIPFDFQTKLLVIEAKINGQQGRFLLDNGFSISGINADFAEKANINWNKNTTASDGNNRNVRLKRGVADLIQIENFSVKKSGIQLIDTKKFLPCANIDGIIGASVINHVNWKLDFQQELIHISANAFEAEGLEVPIYIQSNNSSIFKLTLAGETLKTKIDWGYQGNLKVNQKHRSLYAGKPYEERRGIQSLSVSGLGKQDTIAFLPKVNYIVNGAALPYPLPTTITKHLKYDARIGMAYLSQFNVIINSKDSKYILSTRQDRIPPDLGYSYGAVIYPVKGVYKIIRQSSFHPQAEDFPLMSEVSSINGTELQSFENICDYKRFIRDQKEGNAPIEVLLKGAEESIRLNKSLIPLQPFK